MLTLSIPYSEAITDETDPATRLSDTLAALVVLQKRRAAIARRLLRVIDAQGQAKTTFMSCWISRAEAGARQTTVPRLPRAPERTVTRSRRFSFGQARQAPGDSDGDAAGDDAALIVRPPVTSTLSPRPSLQRFVHPTLQEIARAARADFEVALEAAGWPWSMTASLWVDKLLEAERP